MKNIQLKILSEKQTKREPLEDHWETTGGPLEDIIIKKRKQEALIKFGAH